jgi:RsiW-degrading membrane proteinase PrsW (M82 family)
MKREIPAQNRHPQTTTFIVDHTDGKYMKKPFVIGLAGALFGLVTAFFVILTATSGDMTLSGVQAALFSSLGMGGAAISQKETRFAGWMLLSSAVWITLSVPIAGTLNLLFLYSPAILLLGIAAVLCFKEPEEVASEDL